jgi:hypothetical protein
VDTIKNSTMVTFSILLKGTGSFMMGSPNPDWIMF